MRRFEPLAWKAAVPVVCLLAGLLFAASKETSDGFELRGGRTTELSELVRSAEARVSSAQQRLTELNAELRAREVAAAGSDGRIAGTVAAAERTGESVGLVPLSGPGLTVTLTDAPRDELGRYPQDVPPDALVVHQQDLQSVLNAVWAGGADAVAVQDQRLISTSAVRCIGNTLLLGGRTYSPPYVVTAIGDPDRLRSALDEEYGVQVYRQYAENYGLGYQVESPGSVEVPGYAEDLRLESAREMPR